MNKALIFAVVIFITITACKKETKKEEPVKIEKVEKIDETQKIDESQEIENAFNGFKNLYSELIGFKNDADFKKFGFGEGGKYSEWLKKVREFKQNPDSKLLIKKGVLIEDLEQLGMVYVGSKGSETEVTKTFNKIFNEAISDKPIADEKPTSSEISSYDQLKKDYELFGKWTISNSTLKESYPYEIYKKGNEYIGVIIKDVLDKKTEILIKKGSDYYVKGSKYGEYYTIDQNLNMTLFDKDGDLASVGYKAIKTN